MARYTLKTYCGERQLECFAHRGVDKLRRILNDPKHHKAGQTGPFGEPELNADIFEIRDSKMEKVFEGNIKDALIFISGLK